MSQKTIVAAAIGLLVAQAISVPVFAQATDAVAQPMPLPEQSRNRPNRPNNNNNWNGNNNRPNNNWNNGNNNNWNNNNNNWNNNNNNNNNWGGGNWNGETIRCESRDGRFRSCRADTRGGVRLVRQLSDTPCREGRTWGSRNNEIWVDNGCRGEFQLRYGSGQSSGGGGPSAGAIIGGVAVAGGLIALLSQSGKSSSPATTAAPPPPAGTTATPPPAVRPPAPPAGPARITAQMGGVTPDARPSLQMCLNEAARQVGATGGSEIRLDRLDDVQPGNGGFLFRFQLVAVYPDETRTIATFCRATPTQVIELTFG